MAKFKHLKKGFYKMLAAINKLILPKYSKKDLSKLSKFDKAIIGYRYFITINAIDKD